MPSSFLLSAHEYRLPPTQGWFLNNYPGTITCHFHQVPPLGSYTFWCQSSIHKAMRALKVSSNRSAKEKAYLWGMPVTQAVVPSLDRSQSLRYQFISTSRTSASCCALSWLCPLGLGLPSFPFSEAFLGGLSLPPPEGPDCFFALVVLLSSATRADSILEGPVCVSEKTPSACHQSNWNGFFCSASLVFAVFAHPFNLILPGSCN